MAKVFISYRRTDSAASSGRIYDRLVARFKRKAVFKDVDNIPAGVDFGSYIQASLRECAVMLVVIGPRWLDAPVDWVRMEIETGVSLNLLDARARDGSRLDDPADWVRVEIETGLALGLTVIPLLVEGATMPRANDLPESLRELARLNALLVRNDPDFSHDMERVIAAVERSMASRPASILGIFRRGVASRPTPKQSAPAQSAQPIKHVPAPPPAPDSVAKMTAPPKRSQAAGSPGKTRARSVALAVVAAVLVVVSLSVLISQRIWFSGTGANITATQTVSSINTTTSGAQRLQTEVAATDVARAQAFTARFPLVAAAPGQGCDHGWSSRYWDINYGSVRCASDHTHIATALLCSGSNCTNGGGVDLQFPYPGIITQPGFTISLQVSNRSSNSEVRLIVDGFVNADTPLFWMFDMTDDGKYTVSFHGFNSASLKVSDSHTIAFHFSGRTVTAELDGHAIGSQTEPAITQAATLTLTEVDAEVDAIPDNTATAQADFSNFSITAG